MCETLVAVVIKMDGQRTCVCYDMCSVCESLAGGFMAVATPSKTNKTSMSTAEEGAAGEGCWVGGAGGGEGVLP